LVPLVERVIDEVQREIMVEKYIEVIEYCITKLDPYNLNYIRTII
jgi:hypothetical protein